MREGVTASAEVEWDLRLERWALNEEQGADDWIERGMISIPDRTIESRINL